MNILFLNSAKFWGGNERWSAAAIRSLASRGHKLFLAARTNIFDEMLPLEAATIIKLPFRHELDLSTYLPLWRLIRKNRIDVLVPTKRKDYVIGGVLARLSGAACAMRLGITREVPGWDLPQRFVYKSLPRAIIVNARKTKEILVDSGLSNPGRVHLIYNGYDFPEEWEKFEEARLDTSEFTFAAAGRLSPQKGFDLLLEACALLKSRGARFRIYIAGEGSAREDYERFIAENGLECHVELIGEIRNVRGFFAESDAVIIPSRNEGVPNALFEARSVRKPVLASDAAGIPEVVSHGTDGVLFGLHPEEIADAMMNAINGKYDLKAIGEAGFRKLHSEFTLERMTDKLEALFNHLTGEK